MNASGARIRQSVMRRVYLIYAARQLVSSVALRLYALAALFATLTSLVSVGNVFANIPREGAGAVYEFATYAMMNTDHVVQFLLAATAVVSLWLIRDCIRVVAFPSFFHRAA